jgi:hypothetical protein
MRDPTENGQAQIEPVSSFAPKVKDRAQADQLDAAGASILRLIHKAAGVAEQNSLHALDMAQKLSKQLSAAESRIAELEAEVAGHRDRADRAERWLHKVYTEIEDQFMRKDAGASSQQGRR